MESMQSWQWNFVGGISLEEVVQVIQESKRLAVTSFAMRFVRPRSTRQLNGHMPPPPPPQQTDIPPVVPSPSPPSSYINEYTEDGRPKRSRVGAEFQATILPFTKNLVPEPCDEDELVFSGQEFRRSVEQDEALGETRGRKKREEVDNLLSQYLGANDPELKLTALHYTGYGSNMSKTMEKLDALLAEDSQRLLNPDEALQFESAIVTAGLRDFETVKAIMGSVRPTGHLIHHFYTTFKTSPAYKTFRSSMDDTEYKDLSAARSITCLKCRFLNHQIIQGLEQQQPTPPPPAAAISDVAAAQPSPSPPQPTTTPTTTPAAPAWLDPSDPYNTCVVCIDCGLARHPECLDPPLSRVSVFFRKTWQCPTCLDPDGDAPTYEITNGATTSTTTSLRRRDGSPNTFGDKTTRRRPREEDEDFASRDSDEDEEAEEGTKYKRKRGSGAVSSGGGSRGESYGVRRTSRELDSKGRRIQYLRGVLVDPEVLYAKVDGYGGFDAVCENKLWQTIRKEMGLPHTTSSSYQLREWYLRFLAAEGKAMKASAGMPDKKGEGGRRPSPTDSFMHDD